MRAFKLIAATLTLLAAQAFAYNVGSPLLVLLQVETLLVMPLSNAARELKALSAPLSLRVQSVKQLKY
ncbi:hypothetical protein NP233_g881 [Leucocoprinus birnbaumii]|uniref:Uncharacterized protein n=1 Tax=Leucocoprinus birnbaumii TaxID=56174 RepID=A0AAD5W4X8_9AGAR|nr:hypothetical protein NP233_g881 [Leucocoprinus birnbaumii]